MSKIRTFCFSLLIVIVNYSFAGEIDDANEKYDAGELDLAFSMYEKLASDNDAFVQYRLGFMYDWGIGVVEDREQAVKWYTKAAEQGNADAQYNLGWMYDSGDGVLENDKTAVKWYTKAAEQGNAGAQGNLGVMYDNGDGVLENDKTAVMWYTKAAEQGQVDAQFNLGVMYEYGEGVEENLDIASKWYQKAADQGDLEAEKKLETIISAEIETEIKANEEKNSSLEQSVVLSPVATASSSKYSAWSSKTLCRLLNDTSTSDRYKYVQEAESRGLGCVPDEFSDVVASSVPKQVLGTSVISEPDVSNEEEIKRRAKEKKFGLFNNPGKEIRKLISVGEKLEAYYVYKYNLAFFDKKGLLNGEFNFITYREDLTEVANYHFRDEFNEMELMIADAKEYKRKAENIVHWGKIKNVSEYVEAISYKVKTDPLYKSLIQKTDQYWELYGNVDWIHYRYKYNEDRIVGYFKEYVLVSDSNMFDIYPVELDTYTRNKVVKKAISELADEGRLTMELLNKYSEIYSLTKVLGSNVLSAIKTSIRVSGIVEANGKPLLEVIKVLTTSSKGMSGIEEVFKNRGVNVQLPQDISKVPFVLNCQNKNCRDDSDAGVRIIVAFEQGEAGYEQVGTYSSSVKVRTGTNTVANPRYSYLTRQLDSLRREIERDRAQQQMNQQIYSPNTYDSNCTVYGNRVNCTTTQQGSDYAIGAQGGAMLGQGLNSLFGLTTKEDRYRQLSNELSRTPATVSQAAYTTQRVEIPEYEVVKTARAIIHIFDINNKQYLTLPVELKDREKWLVPNSNNVYQLPLSSSVKERLLPSNLLPNKLLKKLKLDLTKEIYRGASKLKKNQYVTPEEVLAREQLRIESDSKKIASEVIAKKTNSDIETVVASSDQYFEYLANDSFVKWAKSDSVLKRLFDGYLDGNEIAIKLLIDKWKKK